MIWLLSMTAGPALLGFAVGWAARGDREAYRQLKAPRKSHGKITKGL